MQELLSFVEHKGCFDMLQCVISFLNKYQQGHGIIAVSPNYAAQLAKKLSVMWALPHGSVKGILNALPMPLTCLAATYKAEVAAAAAAATEQSSGAGGRQLQQLETVLAAKAAAKVELQAQYGLHIDASQQLVVFMGRKTHQKVCATCLGQPKYLPSRHLLWYLC